MKHIALLPKRQIFAPVTQGTAQAVDTGEYEVGILQVVTDPVLAPSERLVITMQEAIVNDDDEYGASTVNATVEIDPATPGALRKVLLPKRFYRLSFTPTFISNVAVNVRCDLWLGT